MTQAKEVPKHRAVQSDDTEQSIDMFNLGTGIRLLQFSSFRPSQRYEPGRAILLEGSLFSRMVARRCLVVPMRFNLIEQLQVIISRSSKEPRDHKGTLFEHGDIPSVFRGMYDVANSLASKEGLWWVQVKYKQDLMNELQKRQSSRKSEAEVQELPPLLESQLLDFVNSRREDYMQRMTKLLELYARSRWAAGSERKGE